MSGSRCVGTAWLCTYLYPRYKSVRMTSIDTLPSVGLLSSHDYYHGILGLFPKLLPLIGFVGRPSVKRFALCYWSVVCVSCLSVCLSVTLMYCGQTVGWIKMKLGMQIGLGPGHIVLDWNPAPPKGRHSRTLSTFEIYGSKLCLRPDNPRPMSIVTKGLGGSRCHLVRR